MIKGCKEKFFINQIFDENIRRLHQAKKFFGKKMFFFYIFIFLHILTCWPLQVIMVDWDTAAVSDGRNQLKLVRWDGSMDDQGLTSLADLLRSECLSLITFLVFKYFLLTLYGPNSFFVVFRDITQDRLFSSTDS